MLIRMYMPGSFKEDVKINVYQNTLCTKGKRGGRKTSSTLDLTGKHYKIDQIRAKIKCSVLKDQKDQKEISALEVQQLCASGFELRQLSAYEHQPYMQPHKN